MVEAAAGTVGDRPAATGGDADGSETRKLVSEAYAREEIIGSPMLSFLEATARRSLDTSARPGETFESESRASCCAKYRHIFVLRACTTALHRTERHCYLMPLQPHMQATGRTSTPYRS